MSRRALFAALALLTPCVSSPWAHGQPASPAPGSAPAAPAPNKPIPPAKPEDLALVDAALPEAARAKPRRPRLVLVTGRTEGFYHQSIPVGLHAVQQLGARTGAYRVEIDHEMSAFTAENLQRFDAIVFVSTTKLAFDDPAARAALLGFVAGGKGIAGLHAASDNFYTWPEGQALMGGVFHSHPWNAGDTVAVKLDEPTHPVVAAFANRGFWVRDEIYQIVGPYGRDQQRVVLSLDWDRPQNHRPDDKLVRAERDFPIAWVKSHGRGRVFYSSLGHNADIFQTPAILQHFLDGIQFALGDLPAPTEPSAKLSPAPTPAGAPVLPRTLLDETTARRAAAGVSEPALLDALASLTADADPAPARAVTAALRVMEAPARAAYERTLLALARRPALTPYAQLLIAEWLGAIGGPASVPQLRAWAEVPATADEALRNLSLIPGAEADAALGQLLTTAPAAARLTVVDNLGRRRVAAAVDGIVPLLRAEDPALATASLDALGRIASPGALRALADFTPPPGLAEAHTWARLHAARQLAASGDTRRGLTLTRELAGLPTLTPAQQVTAAETLLRHQPGRGLSETLPLLEQPYAGQHLARAWLSAALTTSSPARAITPLRTAFPNLPEATQLALLANAAQLAQPALAAVARTALDTPGATPAVRAAAFAALGGCGDLTTVDLLVAALARPEDRTAAAAALARQTTPGLEARLRAAYGQASDQAAVQTALLDLLAGRLDRDALPLLIAAAKSTERGPRTAGFRGLATLARGEDLELILSLRAQLQPADRRHWQAALLAAVRGRSDVAGTLALLRREMATASAEDQPSFLYALAGLDDPAALQTARELFAGPDAEIRKGLIRALASLRNDNAYTLLIEVAETASADDTERALALRGYIDTLSRRRDRWSETMDDLERAYRAALRDEERDAALAGLRAFDHPTAQKRIDDLKAGRPSPAS